MDILVLGGTRFFGKHLVRELISNGHYVTIATRGQAKDDFGGKVIRIIIERTDPESLRSNLSGQRYDVVFDNIAYCSNDVKYILDIANCNKYVMTSTASVYDIHLYIKENEFDPLEKQLVWCNRTDLSYGEAKRQAECALFQKYSHFKPVAVRFPYVVGTDDYTNRMFFYVEHFVKSIPIFIDNYDSQISFIRSDEAGAFLASFIDNEFCGTINGSSEQTISIRDIADYIKTKTGKSPVLSDKGDEAPYNGGSDFSMNIDKAKELGFRFTPLTEWVYDLIDYYMRKAMSE